MRKSMDYLKDVEQIKIRVLESIKLKVSELYKNHSDLAHSICFAEIDGCQNPIYQESSEDFQTTCIDDIHVVGNDLTFTFSSEVLDLTERCEGELSLDNCIAILCEIEDLEESDIFGE